MTSELRAALAPTKKPREYTPIVSADLFDAVQKAMKVRSKPRKVRKGHNFPFCGLFHCTCGAMISAQWAKGHGGIYRYYRCSRKKETCSEPYVQEKHVAAQCLDRLRPLAITSEEAAEIRALIDAEAKQEQIAHDAIVQKNTEALVPIEEKLRKLTRCLIDDVIDEDSYRVAKEELVLEKTRLKQERQRFNRTGESAWIEPAQRFANTLKTLGKTETSTDFPEISGLVQKIGTNRLISRKTVSFTFSPDYDFVPSLLASARISPASHSSAHSVANGGSTKWCA